MSSLEHQQMYGLERFYGTKDGFLRVRTRTNYQFFGTVDALVLILKQ